MTNTLLTNFFVPRDEHEDGFTLIEILVVIIIIGILAAVAIPIYLNQQRVARDSATTQDVKNAATGFQAAFASHPDSAAFSLGTMNTSGEFITDSDNTIEASVTLYAVRVDKGAPVTLTKTEGTVISAMERPNTKGQYIIRGWNTDGQEYTTQSSPFLYDSTQGGVVKMAGQVIAHGSFENGLEGWTDEDGTLTADDFDNTTAYTGKSSIVAKEGKRVSIIGDAVPVAAGDVWELSAWAKTEGKARNGWLDGQGGIRLQTSTDGGKTWNGYGHIENVNPSTETSWQHKKFMYEVPEDVTHIRPRVAFTGVSGWKAWIDDVQLSKIK